MRTQIVAAINSLAAAAFKRQQPWTVSTPTPTPSTTHQLLVPPELATPDQVSLFAPQIGHFRQPELKFSHLNYVYTCYRTRSRTNATGICWTGGQTAWGQPAYSRSAGSRTKSFSTVVSVPAKIRPMDIESLTVSQFFKNLVWVSQYGKFKKISYLSQ